jgi:hypothetical protein
LTNSRATAPSDIRVGLLSNSAVPAHTIKAGLHATGLLDSSRVTVIDNRGNTPTRQQLAPFDAVLVWTENAFQNPVAVGDTLAAYVDQGGGVVVATYAFSQFVENNWWLGGRLMEPGYSPFLVSTRLASTSGELDLSGASLSHPVFDGITSADRVVYVQNANYTDPPLNGDAQLLARDTSGKRVIAQNRMRDVVGIAIYPGSTNLSTSNPAVSRIFANALIHASAGGFAMTTPFFVDTSPITLTGIARDPRVASVTVQTGGTTSPAVLDTTTRAFTLADLSLTPGANQLIARGFDRNSLLVSSDTLNLTLDQRVPSLVVGPLVIGTTDSSATIALETDELTTVQVAFGLNAGTIDTTKTVDSPEPQRFHQVVLKGLLPDATYYVQVKLTDRAGNRTGFTPSPPIALHTRRGNDTTPPQLVEFPAVTGVTRTSAIFTATTDEIARGLVQFAADDSTQPLSDVIGANNQFFFSHRIPVTGLTGGVTYFYRFRLVDANDNALVTGFQSFTTPLTDDTTPPRITNGPAVLLATARRTVIVYETDEPSDTEVIVNEIGSSDEIRTGNDDLVIEHRVVISNLESDREYEFRVVSSDFLGNTVESKRRTFRTSAPDNLAPVITEGPIVGYNGGAVIVIDVSTDEPATARLDVAPENDLDDISTTFGRINVTNHHLTLTNLVFGKRYRFVVTITDPSGNTVSFPPNGLSAKEISELSETRMLFKVLQSPGLTGRFTTNQGPDTQAPVVLAGPTVVARTSNSLIVSWQTDELSNSAIDYGTSSGLGQNVTSSELVTNHVVTLTNLSQGTTYNYRISSRDIIGNGPTQGPLPSLIAAGTTAGQPDISPPVIHNVSVSGVTNDRAIVAWTTDEPANSFVEFDLTADNLARIIGKSELSAAHTVTLTNLGPGLTYYYRVRSSDGNGNAPGLDVVRSFTTLGDRDLAPPVISNATPRPGYRSVSFSWQTDEPSDSFVELINGIGDTLIFASAAIVTDHTLVVTDTTFLPKGDPQYTAIIGSTDPSRNTSTVVRTFRTVASPDATAPAPPDTVNATPGNNVVVISWNPNTESDFASYEIYRITGADTLQIQSGVTGTTYRDESVVNDTTYTYFLRALDKAFPIPNRSGPSVSATATPSSVGAPSVPALIAPPDSAEVSLKPLLVIQNASSGTGGPLSYAFAVYADAELTQLVAAISGIPEGTSSNPTHWQVLDASLADSVVLQDGVRYWWRSRASNGTTDGQWSPAMNFVANRSIPTAVLTPETPGSNLPAEFSLSQNFPNPFNPATRIRYALPRRGAVTLTVYNILGQKVRRLIDGQFHEPGVYTVAWDGRNAGGQPTGSGLYLYRIEVRDGNGEETFSAVKKMTLVK